VLVGCQPARESQQSLVESVDVPLSYVNVQVSFPSTELTEGLNAMLPTVLMDQGIPLNDKGDTAFVKIVKVGDMDLRFRGGHAYASLPIRVKASIKKKMMGVTFSNEETPIEFKAIVKAKAEVTLSDSWELELNCTWVELDWKDNPNVKILGIKLDLGKKIDKALKENQAIISSKLCDAINQRLKFKKTVTKIWEDLQKPIPIAKNPIKLWLKATPESLSARILPLTDDQLTISVAIRSQLYVLPDKINTPIKELPPRQDPIDTKSTITAYLQVTSSIATLERIMIEQLQGKEYTYEDYHAVIDSVRLKTLNQKVVVQVKVSGSISGMIEVSGTPVLTNDAELKLKDFSYSAELDDEMATVTDWAMHQFAETYLAEQVSYDASAFITKLDSVINAGIGRSGLGNKLSTDLEITRVASHTLFMSETELRWVFYLEGKGAITLKKGLMPTR
jgi:hypothetical protein